MRGIIGLILAGVGAFLILAAILLPTWVAGEVIEFPLNEYQSVTLEASNGSYFSASSLSAKTGVTIEATQTFKGNASQGNSSTAVWDEYTYVYDLTNHQPIQQISRTFAFDRHTAQLVNCCGATVNGDASVPQTGIVGYVFPINTQKKTYQVFDATVKKEMPFVYSGTATVDGIQTYEFTEDYAPTQTGTSPFPGSLVGASSAVVVLPEFNQMHVVYYIDPETGVLVDVHQHQTTTLRNPANGASVVVFDADLAMTPASVTALVGQANSNRSKINLIETILPIILGIVGGVALIAGIFLGRKRRDDTAEANPVAPEMAAAVVSEPAGAHDAANRQAGVVPGLDPEAQEPSAEVPEGERPDAPGPRSAE